MPTYFPYHHQHTFSLLSAGQTEIQALFLTVGVQMTNGVDVNCLFVDTLKGHYYEQAQDPSSPLMRMSKPVNSFMAIS